MIKKVRIKLYAQSYLPLSILFLDPCQRLREGGSGLTTPESINVWNANSNCLCFLSSSSILLFLSSRSEIPTSRRSTSSFNLCIAFIDSASEALRYSLRSSFSDGLKYESLTLPRECPISISTAAGLTPASSDLVLKYLRKP